jgi:hypothetical protein
MGTTPFNVTVTAQDANGNTDPNYSGNVALAIGVNPGSGTLTGGGPVTANHGVANFSVSIDKAGTGYTLTASSGSLMVATSNSFNITGGPTISSIGPTFGHVASTVMISGSNFVGVTIVKFGNLSASFTFHSSTSISAIVPNSASSGFISVTTPLGTYTYTGSTFIVTIQDLDQDDNLTNDPGKDPRLPANEESVEFDRSPAQVEVGETRGNF